MKKNALEDFIIKKNEAKTRKAKILFSFSRAGDFHFRRLHFAKRLGQPRQRVRVRIFVFLFAACADGVFDFDTHNARFKRSPARGDRRASVS